RARCVEQPVLRQGGLVAGRSVKAAQEPAEGRLAAARREDRVEGAGGPRAVPGAKGGGGVRVGQGGPVRMAGDRAGGARVGGRRRCESQQRHHEGEGDTTKVRSATFHGTSNGPPTGGPIPRVSLQMPRALESPAAR